MEENDLQINITAVDEASQTLQAVGQTAEGMAESIDQAAASIQDSLDVAFTAAEQAAIDAAVASTNAWTDASESIDSAMTTTAEAADEAFSQIPESAAVGAEAAAQSWQSSLEDIAAIGAMTQEEVDAAFAGMAAGAEAAAGKGVSSIEGMMSVFRILMLDQIAKQASSALSGALSTIIGAAAGDPTKLAQLTDQMRQLQAQKEKLEQPISGKGKTTGVLWADEAAQAAQLATVNEKIKELQPQINQLTQAQQIGGQKAIDYANATQKLSQDWQTFLQTVGAPLLENAAKTATAIDDLVTKLTNFAAVHPKVAEAVGLTIAALAGLFALAAAVLGILVPIIIVMWLFSVPFTAGAVAIGIAIGIIAALVVFLAAIVVVNWDSIKKWTSETWTAIVKFLSVSWGTIKTDVQDAWTWLKDFIKGIWDDITSATSAAVTAIENLINKILKPLREASSLVGSIGSALGNAGGAIINALPHFAEGGIVNAPTLALVGEAGPEAIIPLSAFNGGTSLAGAGAGAGAGNIIVNIGSLTGTDEAAARRFANIIAQQLNRQIKLKSSI